MYRKMNWPGRILILFVLSVFFVSNALSSAVLAVTRNQFYTQNNILFYDPSGTSSGSCAGTGNTGSLTGNSDKEKAWNFLTGKGLTAEQAAGIIGNLMVESGMVPDNQEDGKPFGSGGWGIAQWTGSRRTDIVRAVQNAGLPYTNEATPKDKYEALLLFELNFLWTEATKRGDIAKLKQETTVDGAVISWEKNFEIAKVPALGERARQAHIAYDAFKGNTGGAASTGSATTGTSTAACGTSVAAGDFVYYSQYDPAWASKPYGTSGKTILESGCGPTSMAMIISTLTGQKVTPDKVAAFGGKYYIPGQGSSHDLFGAAAKNWGLRASYLGKTNEAGVKDTLDKGGLVIGGGSGSDPYTGGGHVIVIRGVTTDGKYIVGNPLPPPSGQHGTSSAEVAQDSAFMNKTYSWAQLSTNTSGMYSVVKP